MTPEGGRRRNSKTTAVAHSAPPVVRAHAFPKKNLRFPFPVT